MKTYHLIHELKKQKKTRRRKRLTSSNFAGGSVHPAKTAGGYIDQFTSSTVQQRAGEFLPINSSYTINSGKISGFHNIYKKR